MNKKQLLSETPEKFNSEDFELEGFFSVEIDKFCLYLNAKLFTFKTFIGYKNKRDFFVGKYRLTQNTI